MEYKTYIARKRARFNAASGPVNIPYGTPLQVEGDFYDQKGNLLRTDFKEKQVRIGKEESNLLNQEKEEGSNRQEGNANLQVLRLDREGITPDFSPEIHEYYLTIPTNIQKIKHKVIRIQFK